MRAHKIRGQTFQVILTPQNGVNVGLSCGKDVEGIPSYSLSFGIGSTAGAKILRNTTLLIFAKIGAKRYVQQTRLGYAILRRLFEQHVERNVKYCFLPLKSPDGNWRFSRPFGWWSRHTFLSLAPALKPYLKIWPCRLLSPSGVSTRHHNMRHSI